MTDDFTLLQIEYDELLLKLSKTPEDIDRIEHIEQIVSEQFGLVLADSAG